MKSVNLEEILLVCVARTIEDFDENNATHMQIGKVLLEEVKKTANFKVIIEAMKIACEQTVDLCAENAIAQQINNRISVNLNSVLIVKNHIDCALF
jgi:hypothetical protein